MSTAAQYSIPDILEDADYGLLPSLARQSKSSNKLMPIPGVGAITATALIASIADPKQFRNSRQLAAWLGLMTHQYSTGRQCKKSNLLLNRKSQGVKRV